MGDGFSFDVETDVRVSAAIGLPILVHTASQHDTELISAMEHLSGDHHLSVRWEITRQLHALEKYDVPLMWPLSSNA
jgi:hypothetical protein